MSRPNRPAIVTAVRRARLTPLAFLVLPVFVSSASAPGANAASADPLQAAQAEWEQDWAWHYPGGVPRPARKPVNRVHHPLALTRLDAGRDLADVVLARAGALLDDLAGEPDCRDLAGERAELESLIRESAGVTRSDAEARKRLYLRACTLRRRIAFANPLLDFQEILFAKTAAGQLEMYQVSSGKVLPGSGLFLLKGFLGPQPAIRDLLAGSVAANGPNAGRAIAGRGSFSGPDLDFDAARVVFSWNEEERPWLYRQPEFNAKACTEKNARHIFSVGLDGKNLRQLTEGCHMDYEPCWLPSGRIAFISQRDPGTNRCLFLPLTSERIDRFLDAGLLPHDVSRLYSMAADGGDVRRHSQHDAAEWTPSVDNDGRLIYGRWDYIDRGIPLQSFWTQYPDGRDPRSPHGNYPNLATKQAGCAPTVGATYMRAVPGDHGTYVYITSNHRIYEWGSLLRLDLNLPDADIGNQLREITPDLDYPTSGHDGGMGSDGPVYSTPWPLCNNYFLVAFRRDMPLTPKTRSRELPYDQRPKFGLYLLDIFGNRELLYRDPAIDCFDPIPVRPRPRPPVIPDQVRDARGRGPAEPATIGIMNVYESDFAWPKDTRITALRIVQVFQNYGGGDEPPMGFSGMALPRIPLGTAPVYEDGSVYFLAPINRMLYFQALDENGLAVQSMRSATSVQAGERLTCVGCHEDKWKAPAASRRHETPLAFRRGRPDPITPEACGTEPFTFPRHVQPILTAKCAGCHVREKKGPQQLADTTLVPFRGGRNKAGKASAAFADLRPYTWFYTLNYGVADNRSAPGKIGARASKLLPCLSPQHHGVQLTDRERRMITLWMDLNSPYYCSIFDRAKQHAGELVYPRHDFNPANFFGTEAGR
jgi:hypothetical protein